MRDIIHLKKKTILISADEYNNARRSANQIRVAGGGCRVTEAAAPREKKSLFHLTVEKLRCN
jgi:hypothetical protein